jgi:hypothetical protein
LPKRIPSRRKIGINVAESDQGTSEPTVPKWPAGQGLSFRPLSDRRSHRRRPRFRNARSRADQGSKPRHPGPAALLSGSADRPVRPRAVRRGRGTRSCNAGRFCSADRGQDGWPGPSVGHSHVARSNRDGAGVVHHAGPDVDPRTNTPGATSSSCITRRTATELSCIPRTASRTISLVWAREF